MGVVKVNFKNSPNKGAEIGKKNRHDTPNKSHQPLWTEGPKRLVRFVWRFSEHTCNTATKPLYFYIFNNFKPLFYN